jgi:hypothetical protein
MTESKTMRLEDILAFSTKEVVSGLVSLSHHYIESIDKDEEDEGYIEYVEHKVAIINLSAARIITQKRAMRFLLVGIVVTNGMWFANLMGWI